ncbi:type II secretion system protein GspM [Ruegeria sp. SCPT10]|uniref:type II secretion system protein GspM n=1 Tax=Ruegeria sp. SCP10 TaxID=3141377 RepID=UPI00333BFE4A
MLRRRYINATGAFAACAAIAVLVCFSIVAPLNAWKARGLEMRNQALSEIDRTQATIDRLKQQSEILAQNENQEFLWRAEQIGAVTAKIQTVVTASAANNGVSLRSITPLKAKRIATVDAASFRLEFEASLDQVTGFLKEIEYATPALLVEKAQFRQFRKPADDRSQPVLNAQLELIAPIYLEEVVAE